MAFEVILGSALHPLGNRTQDYGVAPNRSDQVDRHARRAVNARNLRQALFGCSDREPMLHIHTPLPPTKTRRASLQHGPIGTRYEKLHVPSDKPGIVTIFTLWLAVTVIQF